MARFNSNIEICNKLIDFFNKEECKDIRFFQALQILKLQDIIILEDINHSYIEDNFNEESLTTLKKIIEYEKTINSK